MDTLQHHRLPVYKVQLVREKSIAYTGDAQLRSSADAVAVIREELLASDRERLLCLMLNARHRMIGLEEVSVGSATASIAAPREIFKAAILKGVCCSILIAHNHPSGDPSPSDDDIRLTRRIAEAGRILGIELVDHVIVAENGHYSFKSKGGLL